MSDQASRRNRAYLMHQRLGFLLGREQLKQTLLGSTGHNVAPEDVDLLPWDETGRTVDMTRMRELQSPQNAAVQAQRAAIVMVDEAMGVCQTCKAVRKPDGRALLACSRCGCANYCSRECQMEDWKLHKRICGLSTRVMP